MPSRLWGSSAGGVSQSYVDSQIALKVAKAGDTMSGQLVIPAGSTGSPGIQVGGTAGVGLSYTGTTLKMASGGVGGVNVTPTLITASTPFAFRMSLYTVKQMTAATINMATTDVGYWVFNRAGNITVNLPQMSTFAGGVNSPPMFFFSDPLQSLGTYTITIAGFFDTISSYDTINAVAPASAGGTDFTMTATGGLYMLVGSPIQQDPMGLGGNCYSWICKQIG